MQNTLTTEVAEFEATRLSHTTHPPLQTAGPCLLVRIYPLKAIEKPFELAAENTLVGRDPVCGLFLDEDSVSRRHASLEARGQGHVIRDLGSTNGVYVNEQRVLGERTLTSGDRVRFGSQIFKYLAADRLETDYHEVAFRMMTTDGLTGLHNKRYFLDVFERECLQAKRGYSPLCVLVMDLDRFKQVNDTFGHLAGDAVLVEFAGRLREEARGGELLVRFGGEEFLMLLSRTSLAEGLVAAERVRQAATARPALFEEHTIPFTVSIGVACFEEDFSKSPQSVLAQADAMLYKAKQSGRNQVQSLRGT